MSDMMKYQIGKVYFALFGVIVFSFGAAEIILGVAGKDFEWGVLEMSGDFLVWRGLILAFAGLFYMFGVKNFADIHQQAKVVMASVMIWMIAGMRIFGMILESVPGGEDGGWFNTWEGFLATFSAPYIPSLFLLPFSLVVIYYMGFLREPEEEPEKT